MPPVALVTGGTGTLGRQVRGGALPTPGNAVGHVTFEQFLTGRAVP